MRRVLRSAHVHATSHRAKGPSRGLVSYGSFLVLAIAHYDGFVALPLSMACLAERHSSGTRVSPSRRRVATPEEHRT